MAGPAMVADNLGIFAAIRRSAELTRTRRWPICLAYLVCVLILLVVEAAFIVTAGGRSGVRAMTTMEVVTPFTRAMMGLVHPGLGLAMAIGFNTFTAALFHRLRSGRVGEAGAAIAEVFA